MRIPGSVIGFLQYLYEMASQKSYVEDQIGKHHVPITNHIIKVLKWKDDTNLHKHLDDIDKWLMKTLSWKYNKKRPDQQTFYEKLFYNRIEHIHNIKKIIKRDLKKYHDLSVLRTDEQVYEIMKEMMWEISGDLSKNKYKDFEDYYFPKYNK